MAISAVEYLYYAYATVGGVVVLVSLVVSSAVFADTGVMKYARRRARKEARRQGHEQQERGAANPVFIPEETIPTAPPVSPVPPVVLLAQQPLERRDTMPPPYAAEAPPTSPPPVLPPPEPLPATNEYLVASPQPIPPLDYTAMSPASGTTRRSPNAPLPSNHIYQSIEASRIAEQRNSAEPSHAGGQTPTSHEDIPLHLRSSRPSTSVQVESDLNEHTESSFQAENRRRSKPFDDSKQLTSKQTASLLRSQMSIPIQESSEAIENNESLKTPVSKLEKKPPTGGIIAPQSPVLVYRVEQDRQHVALGETSVPLKDEEIDNDSASDNAQEQIDDILPENDAPVQAETPDSLSQDEIHHSNSIDEEDTPPVSQEESEEEEVKETDCKQQELDAGSNSSHDSNQSLESDTEKYQNQLGKVQKSLSGQSSSSIDRATRWDEIENISENDSEATEVDVEPSLETSLTPSLVGEMEPINMDLFSDLESMLFKEKTSAAESKGANLDELTDSKNEETEEKDDLVKSTNYLE